MFILLLAPFWSLPVPQRMICIARQIVYPLCCVSTGSPALALQPLNSCRRKGNNCQLVYVCTISDQVIVRVAFHFQHVGCQLGGCCSSDLGFFLTKLLRYYVLLSSKCLYVLVLLKYTFCTTLLLKFQPFSSSPYFVPLLS